MDTEHGFVRKLKARRGGILRFPRLGMIARKGGPSMQAQYAGGQDAGHLAKTFVGRHGRRIVE